MYTHDTNHRDTHLCDKAEHKNINRRIEWIHFFFAASRLRQLCVSGLLYARGSFHATVYHWHRTNDFTETT